MDLSGLHSHGPGVAGEWGSGGIYGLTYHKGVLYYMLAFDARAYFLRHLPRGREIEGEEFAVSRIYGFKRLLEKLYAEKGCEWFAERFCGGHDARRTCPRSNYEAFMSMNRGCRIGLSGGDTYNAVAAVDEYIYFGGWVHVSPRLIRHGGLGRIDFSNKYSHIHRYNVDNHDVELLWYETAGEPDKWVGEISEIIYDPIEQKLLLPRGDGMLSLGVYVFDIDNRVMERISDDPGLKGAIYYDYACFDKNRGDKIYGVHCYDLFERRWSIDTYLDLSAISIDGGTVEKSHTGHMNTVAGRLLLFTKSGVLVSEPLANEYYFVRLLDFTETHYTPSRVKPLIIGGGVLTAYNPYTHAALYEAPYRLSRSYRRTNDVVGPSLLIYYSPPAPRIVAALGARVTAMESIGDRILVAANTWANMGGMDASLIDHGHRGFIVLPHSIVTREPPPVTIKYRPGLHERRVWGGIPLTGYREPLLKIYGVKGGLELTIHEYDAGSEPMLLSSEKMRVSGDTVLELKGYGPIVSFETPSPGGAVFVINLS